MKILAFDTTAKTATVALTENEKPIGFTVLNTGNTHSETLLPMTDAMLCNAGEDIKNIDMFVCTVGPGSFTGVRIGTSTVKGLAFADDKICVGVSALEALAMNIFADEGVICAVMDARRKQLYNALFKADAYGKITRLTEDRVISADDLRKELENEKGKIFLSGDGYDIAKAALAGLNTVEVPMNMTCHNAYSAAVLGYRKYMQASETERKDFTAKNLSPVYLRACQAERERLEKENKAKDN